MLLTLTLPKMTHEHASKSMLFCGQHGVVVESMHDVEAAFHSHAKFERQNVEHFDPKTIKNGEQQQMAGHNARVSTLMVNE